MPEGTHQPGMGEEDGEGWKALTKALGRKLQLVGDDSFVTNSRIFAEGSRDGIANTTGSSLHSGTPQDRRRPPD